jgi:hypothetical protein
MNGLQISAYLPFGKHQGQTGKKKKKEEEEASHINRRGR